MHDCAGQSYRPPETEHRALMCKVAAKIILDEEREEALNARLGRNVSYKRLNLGFTQISQEDLVDVAGEEMQGEAETETQEVEQDASESKILVGPSGKKMEAGVKLSR
jgi:hypothetical protein